jgi:hypothetical protein
MLEMVATLDLAPGDPRLLVVVLAGDEGGGTSRGFN